MLEDSRGEGGMRGRERAKRAIKQSHWQLSWQEEVMVINVHKSVADHVE